MGYQCTKYGSCGYDIIVLLLEVEEEEGEEEEGRGAGGVRGH